MLDYLNPMPLITYFRSPTAEHAESAIAFLKNHEALLDTIGHVAKKSLLILSALTVIAFLLQSRDIIRRDEETVSGSSQNTEESSISTIEIFSKLFFTMTILSGFSYLSSKSGSYFASYGITWINSYK